MSRHLQQEIETLQTKLLELVATAKDAARAPCAVAASMAPETRKAGTATRPNRRHCVPALRPELC